MPPKSSKRKAANGYRLPDPIPEGEVVTGLNKKRWRIGKSIGVGGFGEIYLCSEDVDRAVGESAKLALKIEPHENGPLFVEMNFYIRAAQPEAVQEFKQKRKLASLGMPVHCGSGSHVFKGDKYRFLVMERFGEDLQKLFQTGKKKFPPKASFNIAIKVIDTLEYIHSRGYVHNDIKAQNLLLGRGRSKENDICLVDFGLVSKYQRDGVHLEYKPDARKAHDGTIEYTSRDAHIGAHSRRSDLEILGYNIVHWISGMLPWMDNLTNPQYVQTQKQGFMSDIPAFLQQCFGEQDFPAVLEEYLDYVANLDFHTEPDYDKCRNMFTKALKKLKIPLDGKLDFSTPDTSSAKKVGSSPSPLAKKRKSKVIEDAAAGIEGEKSETEQEPSSSLAAAKRPKKAKIAKPKLTRKVISKEIGVQTSPAFVKKVKAAKKAAGRGQNPEMEELAAKALKAATDVRHKRGKGEKAKIPNQKSENDVNLSNPTPAMAALMRKRQEAATKKFKKYTGSFKK